MKTKIRKATPKDLKKVSEIFRVEYAKKPYYERWNEKTALRRIKTYYKELKIHVAEVEKEIVGLIIFSEYLWDNGMRGFVEEFVVDSKFQGKGIGKALLKSVEKIYKKKGYKSIALIASTKAKAYNIYRKKGYKQEKQFVYMKKRLN